ncbi:MAG: ATP-binding protein, partial [Cyclobacteriaceae bacterium]
SANEKEIDLIHHRNEDIYIWFDIDHFKTALRNVIGNAIKFTGRRGKVIISYKEEDGHVKLIVADTGIGIAAEDIKQVFKFRGRSKSIGTNNEKGTGIGLMLSKEFIESNGGRIEVTSEPGVGSEFILLLPVTKMEKNETKAMMA